MRAASAAVWTALYTADWASQCREQAADRHLPALYGSGAAVVVHHLGTCCSKRPFSSHCRSRRPWRDFLQGCLTFCLGLTAAGGDAVRSFYRCKVDFYAGLRINKARRGPASFCGVRWSLCSNVKISKTVILPGCQTKTSAPSVQGCSRCAAVACVCLCVEVCARLRCASTKLCRINAAFTDSRKLVNVARL
ncbi:hypothetical protein PAMP_021015 [Pampus punctatissimus]